MLALSCNPFTSRDPRGILCQNPPQLRSPPLDSAPLQNGMDPPHSIEDHGQNNNGWNSGLDLQEPSL